MRVETHSAGAPNAELTAALDALHRDVYANNMAPYWVVDRSVAHDEDRQVQQGRKAVPFIWKYQRQIEPLLRRSAALIKTETSERRSLVLVNPGLAPQRATASTLYVAYRVNDPREIMPPHRHSPNAIRWGSPVSRISQESRARTSCSGPAISC
jgi:gentisate 1,2-dioxygenase